LRFNQIHILLAVADSGSVRGAARKLEVSPPAVTKSLRQLEEELRVHLFERTPHGLVLTQAGRAFTARARTVQSELRKAKEDLAALSGGEAESVAVGASSTEMALLVPDAVAELRRQFPGSRVRVVEGRRATLLPLVRDGTLDFAACGRITSDSESGLAFRPLFRSEYIVVARKGHPLRNERSLARLANAEWVALATPRGQVGLVEQAFVSADLAPSRPPTIECESFNGMVSMLAKTDMLAMIAHRLLTMPSARDVLQQVHVVEPLPSLTHGMFMRVDNRPTRAVAALLKSVSAVARKLAARR